MKKRSLQYFSLFNIFAYFFLSLFLSTISANFSFILFAFFYVMIVVILSLFIEKPNRLTFNSITFLFFLVYSLFAVASYFFLYQDPLLDYLGDVDQKTYYNRALYLSSLSITEIWITAFDKLPYSEAPIFNAWLGTLHKISRLNTYFGALNQKLNVVFFSSFIPTLLYLMLEKVIGNKRVALKWSIIFGFFSVFFYYSGIILRDVHITLIYTLAFYLILREQNRIKVFFLLIILGIISYYIRVENGFFFLSFFGLLLIYRSFRLKFGVIFLAIPVITLMVISIVEFNYIIEKGFKTLQAYGERKVHTSSSDSYALALTRLPIPLNWFSTFIFSQIAPFPIWAIFEDNWLKNIFHLPRVVGTLFWTFIWVHIIFNISKLKQVFNKFKWPILLAISYIFLVSQGSTYERRLFQVYPFLFVIFVTISYTNKKKSMVYFIFTYFILICFYSILKYY